MVGPATPFLIDSGVHLAAASEFAASELVSSFLEIPNDVGFHGLGAPTLTPGKSRTSGQVLATTLLEVQVVLARFGWLRVSSYDVSRQGQ